MGIVIRPSVSSHVIFARAHDLHRRVTPARVAVLVVNRTVGQAFGELLAYGYRMGYDDGRADALAEVARRRHVREAKPA